MIDSNDGRWTRREFIASAMMFAGAPLLFSRQPAPGAASPASEAPDVLIAEFSEAGRKIGVSRVEKVVKPDAEWRRQLSPLAFEVTRHGETEYAFSGAYWNLHEKGLFRCVCCDTALFSSKEKFDSGTGWPSFWQPVSPENVGGRDGRSAGPRDTEVTCQRCDAHLGDVFGDGPRPTGLRYCIDSVALRFVAFA
jgi:peptide-methionine (R)-S-oxide reductase